MSPRRELAAFTATLAALIAGFLSPALFGGRVLSPADVLFASHAFDEFGGLEYEPANRLLIDPVLQLEPWLEHSRTLLRQGRLPLWNDLAGCGAPHLANGQSAVFDPFHLIAYLGSPPTAHAWMAAARLGFAGLGMFLLARAWGLGPWGRWFAGLAFPFCGFVIVWLLFPSASVAVWMPWVFLATERLLDRPDWNRVGPLALAIGGLLLGGHVQTSAHVLIAAFIYMLTRLNSLIEFRRIATRWLLAAGLGMALGATAILPLAAYLTRSPVWTDRAAGQPGLFAVTKPRLLDAVCTIFPYIYGSQRRGHPNLARALGVHNLNESAGGYAGLVTICWLAPIGLIEFRRDRRVRFVALMVALAALGAFDIPPVANVLRAIPILKVIDHRRLSLLLAFGLILLGAWGLDSLRAPGLRIRAAWLTLAAGLITIAFGVVVLEPNIRARAIAHYSKAASGLNADDAEVYRRRAEHQTHLTRTFLPHYALTCAAELTALAVLAWALQRRRPRTELPRASLFGLAILDLFAFGFRLNPDLPPELYRPESRLIQALRSVAPPPGRILALDPELPPNTLMRYGLADIRNYDSIEMNGNLEFFDSLYEPGSSRTCRREVNWKTVERALDRLAIANVVAIVARTPPPEGLFSRVERIDAFWIARPEVRRDHPIAWSSDHGRARVVLNAEHPPTITLPLSYDPGWRAECSGRPIAVRSTTSGAFLECDVPEGPRRVDLRYDPSEVRVALAGSGLAACLIVASLVWRPGARSEPKTRLRSWMVRQRRVRIDSMISARSGSPAYLEGRNADGPLHV